MADVIPAAAAPATAKAPDATVVPAPAPAVVAAPAPGAPAAVTNEPGKVVVPEKYNLTMPEGSQFKSDHVDKIASFAKERGLSNDQAQAILQRDHEAEKASIEANKPGTGEAWKERVSTWEKAALADKEIGGTPEALLANAELGKRALNAYFSESISKYLVDTGLGSHPEIIKGFAKLGRAMADDKLVLGGKAPKEAKSLESVFYPEAPKEGA